MSPKCPSCGTVISATPDAMGFVVCSHCGVRLRVQAGGSPTATAADIQAVVAELRTVRRMQGEILQMQAQVLAHLKAGASAPAAPVVAPAAPKAGAAGAEKKEEEEEKGAAESPAAPPPIPRVRQRRKTVLIVDDDEDALKAAVASLEQAQIPLRTVSDGNAALAALSESKPDVLVLELGIGEPMAGKDLINYIKATMEWIDIPIVLYTRIFVESQQEARTIHGADEVVVKGPGSPEALLNRVISIFQRH